MDWNDFLIITMAAAFLYRLLLPTQKPKLTLTPKEVARALEIQSKPRWEFSAVSWITGKQELPVVRGWRTQRERRRS